MNRVIKSRLDWSVMWILLIGLALRVGYVSSYPQQVVSAEENDAGEYDQIATSLLKTGAYESFRRPPLYPAFLAAIYSVFGHSYFAVRLVQSLLSSLAGLGTFFIAREVVD